MQWVFGPLEMGSGTAMHLFIALLLFRGPVQYGTVVTNAPFQALESERSPTTGWLLVGVQYYKFFFGGRGESEAQFVRLRLVNRVVYGTRVFGTLAMGNLR